MDSFKRRAVAIWLAGRPKTSQGTAIAEAAASSAYNYNLPTENILRAISIGGVGKESIKACGLDWVVKRRRQLLLAATDN
ncbi:hypothetical protein [Caballeronia novacaledonica]|uniref:Uncharacterized protein n=1 Tax=Caballeronia novacaledonica TaxID=1544861 RepID=A0AA37IM41_9BURK|nr:hypothetical protein [Caballeronia novacaledonica]GJH29306.1 hypothetical protein CBA19CS42_32340 [Caballeronia novacaledonica]